MMQHAYHISSCIYSTSVDILAVSFLGTIYHLQTGHEYPPYTQEGVFIKGGLTILYAMYPISGSLKLSFISVYILFLHLNV